MLRRLLRSRAGEQGALPGDVPLFVRRCAGSGPAAADLPLSGPGERSFATLDLGNDAVAPELAYITARYAALTPFGKVATLLSELLPMSGARNAGTVSKQDAAGGVGEAVVQREKRR